MAVLHCYERVLRLSLGAKMDGRAAAVAQFQMAGHEVRVEVGQENMPNCAAELLGIRQVLLDVALRVDDSGATAALVGDEIRSVRQAT